MTASDPTTAAARPAIPAAISEPRVVAIGRRLEPAAIVEVAEALRRGGVRAFELTLDGTGVLDGIAALSARFGPEELLVGAGTVLSVADAATAIDAGARFLVSPHTDPALVGWAASRGIPCFPGALTPTEILGAWRAGAAAVKLFPASAVGPAFVREHRGPFRDIPLIPTGGVTAETAPAFIAAGAIAVGLGSWLTRSGDPGTIEGRARDLVAALAGAALPGSESTTMTGGDTAEVVALGEAFIGLVADEGRSLADATTFRPHVIGAEANTAVGLARLGRRAAFVGRVGADGLGTAIVRRLRGEGVDTRHVIVDPDGPTGLMLRERRELGASQAVYHRRGSAGSRLSPEDVAAAGDRIRAATWLHVTGITPALSATARDAHAQAIDLAIEAGVQVSFAVNLRRLLWSDEEAAAVLGPLARRTTLVIGSTDELATVAGTEVDDAGATAAGALLAAGVTTVIATLGAVGTVLYDRTGAGLAVDALPVARVVDPVGAGDAFAAGFLAARLDGLADPIALRWAVACGAAAVTVEGDMDGLPDRVQLDRLVGGEARDIVR